MMCSSGAGHCITCAGASTGLVLKRVVVEDVRGLLRARVPHARGQWQARGCDTQAQGKRGTGVARGGLLEGGERGAEHAHARVAVAHAAGGGQAR